jgi:6-phosphofructokinase
VYLAGVVDVCLIPEVHFNLDKLKACVASVLEKKGHCVVCVAEGAGQVGSVAEQQLCAAAICMCPCDSMPIRERALRGLSW